MIYVPPKPLSEINDPPLPPDSLVELQAAHLAALYGLAAHRARLLAEHAFATRRPR